MEEYLVILYVEGAHRHCEKNMSKPRRYVSRAGASAG